MTVTINGTTGVTAPEVTLDNSSADGGQVVLKSSGYSNWNWDNYSGNLRAYYGSTEAMRIDSSGNVGIGTSSPSDKLDIASGNIRLTTGQNLRWVDSGNIRGALAVDGSSNLLAYTAGSERMRIDSNGRVAINNAGAIDVSRLSMQMASGDNGISIRSYDSSSAVMMAQFYMLNGNRVGYIQSNSSSTSYNTSSDYRLKENIQPMTGALATVAQLNPVTYNWKADGSDGQGFIAHELQAVVPDCVTGEKDAVDEEGNPVYQGIDTSFLVATLTKAIQEQQAQIETLTAKVAALGTK